MYSGVYLWLKKPHATFNYQQLFIRSTSMGIAIRYLWSAPVQCLHDVSCCRYGGFLGFPTKHDHFGVEIGGTTI